MRELRPNVTNTYLVCLHAPRHHTYPKQHNSFSSEVIREIWKTVFSVLSNQYISYGTMINISRKHGNRATDPKQGGKCTEGFRGNIN